MAATIHVDPSTRHGRRCTTEADRLRLDAIENVGEPTSLRRQRESPDMFTRYMALMRKCIVIEPSSFEEEMQKPIWVDSKVEEYESIIKKNAWEVIPRLVGKSVIGSRWIYKVKQETYESVENYKARFVAWGFSQVEGIYYEETFALVARYSSIKYILSLLV